MAGRASGNCAVAEQIETSGSDEKFGAYSVLHDVVFKLMSM
jgi:hypothetical protein